MVSSTFILSALVAVGVNADASAGASNWNWDNVQSRSFNGDDKNTFKYFDANYMMALVGTNGVDQPVLHSKSTMPKVALTAMEKVTAMTSVSTRASIRSQLVNLLKAQVRIESMYGSKKEKLYLSASSVYNFIARLLHSACNIALSNDVLWKEQMQCFSAYRQLLEVYAMWNGIRDVSFALEHGMAVTPETLAVCGPDVAIKEHFVAQNPNSQRLQNQYLVAGTMRKCYDNMQIRIEALRRWLSASLVAMDSNQDRAQSCLFRVITVLTCLSAGNQENVLDLAIKEEHKQHVTFGLARYASIALADADQANQASMLETNSTMAPSSAFVEIESASEPTLREVRKVPSA
jgi:hypothetical protein